MGKETLIMFFGAWVAVESFLGFPLLWDEVIYGILGVCIVLLGILLRRDALRRRARHAQRAETFAENAPEVEEEIAPEVDETSSV